jgi:hypothetical protein
MLIEAELFYFGYFCFEVREPAAQSARVIFPKRENTFYGKASFDRGMSECFL